jgi:hypothetical protein
MVYTIIVMVYTMVYIYGIYHDIYHLPFLYIPWYIPKVVYTTFGVVYTMRQPSRCRGLGLRARSHWGKCVGFVLVTATRVT